jgi:hypothetical protein
MSAQEKMENETNIFGDADDEDEDEEEIQEEFDAEDFFEMMKEKKKNKLH